MKIAEIGVKVACARREMEYWQAIIAKKSCGDCIHFQVRSCELAGGIAVPPEVQKTGCPEWNWDNIPF